MKLSVDQIRELIRQRWHQVSGISPTIRVGSMLLLVISVSALIWWTKFAPKPTTVLFQGQDLTRASLDQIANAFLQADLTDFSMADGQVRVPKDQVARYLEAAGELASASVSLTHNQVAALRDVNPFESAPNRERRLLQARERDLATAIRRIEGIDDAFVHYDQIIQSGLKRKRIVTASVGVLTEPNAAMRQSTVQTIRRMVAATYAGMQVGDVTISDLRSGRSYGGWLTEDSAVPRAEEFLHVKQMFEQFWQRKIEDVLQFVPNVQVVTNAHMGQPTNDQSLDPVNLETRAKLAVSVNVPLSYHLNRFEGSTPPRQPTLDRLEAETELQIRHAVQGLSLQRKELISLSVTTFDDRSFVPTTRPEKTGRIGGLTRTAAAAIALLIAAIGALVVHVISRHQSRAVPSASAAALHHPMVPDNDPSLDADSDATDREDGELRATLTDLVQNDPDNAARILNEWMKRAG